MLALIVDDAGYSLEDLQAFLDLPMPLTVAVLPNLPHSTRGGPARARRRARTCILHCPMEPVGEQTPGRAHSAPGRARRRSPSFWTRTSPRFPGHWA